MRHPLMHSLPGRLTAGASLRPCPPLRPHGRRLTPAMAWVAMVGWLCVLALIALFFRALQGA